MWHQSVLAIILAASNGDGALPSGWGFPLVGEVVASPEGRPISRLALRVDEEPLRRALRVRPYPGIRRGEAAYRLLERGGIRFVLVQRRLEDLGPRARREMMLAMLRPHIPAKWWTPERGDLARFLAWGEHPSDAYEVVVMLVDPGKSWEIVQGGETVLRLTDPALLRALFQVFLGKRPGDPCNREAIVRMLEDFTATKASR